jgi:peptide/nickel transport system ATP-binding protein
MRSVDQVVEAHRFVGGKSWFESRDASRKDFHRFDLSGSERSLPGALSGGMAQRVAFAAATAADAPILIADEPTKGLDPTRSDRTVGLLADVPRSGGALLAITHDLGVARRLGGEIIVLKNGDLVEQGGTKAVLDAPAGQYTKTLISADPTNWPRAQANKLGPIVLTAKDIAVTRGDGNLVEGFSLTLRAGERIAITGPSGVGKTSLLDTLSGLIRPAAGSIERSQLVTRHGVQKLYQDPPAAFPPKITLGKSLRDVAALHNTDWRFVEILLGRLGIDRALMDRYPAAVSGGELQRIAIARALAARPAVLLADEPTSRLDPVTQRETMELLGEITAEQGVSIVLVTHELAMANHWSTKTVEISPHASSPHRNHGESVRKGAYSM